jgi:NAD(P)H-dependent FMN reductase
MNTHSPIKILGISGSLRKNSSCSLILSEARRLAGNALEIEIYDGIRSLRLFDDPDDPSREVSAFKEKIRTASGVLICQPEYAFGVSGALKNALDWTVGTGEFSKKPVALITAATGGLNAHEALQKTLTAIDCTLSRDTQLLITAVKSKIDGSGRLKDDELVNRIVLLLDHLEALVRNTPSLTY